jgi:hypothetical protein
VGFLKQYEPIGWKNNNIVVLFFTDEMIVDSIRVIIKNWG